MFKPDFKAQADKHLGAFRKAVNGLYGVRAAIQVELKDIKANQTTLLQKHDTLAAEAINLTKHHDQLGDTILKINALLPGGK